MNHDPILPHRKSLTPKPKSRRGSRKKELITGETTVYTAAAWWRDSDPSMQAVCLTAKKCASSINEQMRESARSARDDGSYNSIHAALDGIAWSGVHAISLGDIATGHELEQAIRDLEENGCWYPERG